MPDFGVRIKSGSVISMDIRVLIGSARNGFFRPSLTVDGWLRLIDSDAQLGTGIPRPDPLGRAELSIHPDACGNEFPVRGHRDLAVITWWQEIRAAWASMSLHADNKGIWETFLHSILCESRAIHTLPQVLCDYANLICCR
jgi:hypothetical protein